MKPDFVDQKTDLRPANSLLERFPDNELHDIVCVGFGPAALAIAIALHDAIEAEDPTLVTLNPKVRFIERQPQYAWHPGMLLEDSKMQITFLKDLATLRNPRSKFTFMNYLLDQGRLVQFANLGTMLPKRLEYNDYMTWCASAFDHVVDYGQTVTSVKAVLSDSPDTAARCFQVTSTNYATGEQRDIQAKHVIVAVGGRPSFPDAFKAPHPRIIHSSQYVTEAENLFIGSRKPERIAVVGAGQSAAEIFYDIPSRFPGAQSVLITRRSALRPSDDSPFVNEVFDPARTDDVFAQDDEVRANEIAANRSTNYGVVRLDLLENIYSTQYSYKVKHLPEEDWPHRILNHCTVIGVRPANDAGSGLRLMIRNDSRDYQSADVPRDQELDVDLIIVACGYERNTHNQLMEDLLPLRPEGDLEGWTIGRNYSVNFTPGALERDTGVWLQGCNEKTHGLPDSLLSILSVRGGEMVKNILGTSTQKQSALQHLQDLVSMDHRAE